MSKKWSIEIICVRELSNEDNEFLQIKFNHIGLQLNFSQIAAFSN
jgi:hypothetical protein